MWLLLAHFGQLPPCRDHDASADVWTGVGLPALIGIRSQWCDKSGSHEAFEQCQSSLIAIVTVTVTGTIVAVINDNMR